MFHGRWLRTDVSIGKGELLIGDIRNKAEIIKQVPVCFQFLLIRECSFLFTNVPSFAPDIGEW